MRLCIPDASSHLSTKLLPRVLAIHFFSTFSSFQMHPHISDASSHLRGVLTFLMCVFFSILDASSHPRCVLASRNDTSLQGFLDFFPVFYSLRCVLASLMRPHFPYFCIRCILTSQMRPRISPQNLFQFFGFFFFFPSDASSHLLRCVLASNPRISDASFTFQM